MNSHSKVFFSLILLITFSIGLITLIPQYKSNQSNTITDQNVSIDDEPYLFYAMGPNGELPEEMTSKSPPELHPSPTGNTILLTDDFETYKTDAEFIASPWAFYEPANTHCNLKENKTFAQSGKRYVELYDNNNSEYTMLSRSFSAVTQYLYLKIYLYAKQTTGCLIIYLQGVGGSCLIAMGGNSNQWLIGTGGSSSGCGHSYIAGQWYQIELFANILKNTYDFYVDNVCFASNISFYTMGATNLNSILIFTSIPDISASNYYYIDNLEIAIPPKILCLLVQFSDMTNSNSVNAMYQKIFTNAGSLRNYYKENSYNKFTVAGTVTPWIQMPDTMVYYGADGSGTDNGYGPRRKFADAAIATANSMVNFSIYDHVIIIHSGNDQSSSTGNSNDIWAACYTPSSGYSYGPVDGVYITHICWVSEQVGVGVGCHEFGHMLDLPDLYHYGLPKGTPDDYVGDWGLMASGSWNGAPSGTSPAHMMAWDKNKLGWLSSGNIETIAIDDWDNGVYLNPLELSTTKEQAMKIEIDSSHYYLVESRLNLGFDNYLPDQGIIISYIDETKGSGQGIVQIQNSHPGSTDLNEAAWDLSGASEWQVFRDITRKIYVTVGPKSGNIYLLSEERYSSTNRTYQTITLASGFYQYWDLAMTAGQIAVWDWFANGNLDFWIVRLSDSQEFERINGVNHDGGLFRAPTSATYRVRLTNNNPPSKTFQIALRWLTDPNLEIYELINLDSPVYRSNQFTLRLQVRNTGGSLVEGVTATLNLPSGLNLVDGWQKTINLDDLGYNEYATAYWEIYAAASGSKSVQVVMTSTWGGAPTQNLTINVLLDTISPVLSLTGPSNNSLRTNRDVTVSWTVYEYETAIKTISIFLNNSLIVNTTNNNYNFIGLSDGLHYCKVIAYDLENNAAQKLVIFRIDTKRPVLAKITGPIALRWYAGQIQIVANAYDNGSGVAFVRFYNGNPASGGILLGTDSNSTNGWRYNWITSSSDNGNKILFVRVYDNAGWYNDSTGVSISIDNSPPINLNCLTLQNNGNYKGKIPIRTTVSDPLSGMRNVEFWINGILFYNDTTVSDGWNCTWSTTSTDDGTRTITIKAYDSCGNLVTLNIPIKVDNSPPTNLNCISLQNGATYRGNINIQVTVIDAVTDIRNVEFWLGIPGSGGILIYNDTTSSNGWNYLWSTTQEDDGNHTIFIRAYDGCGNANTLMFSVIVQNAQPFNYLLLIIIGIAVGAGIASIFVIKHVKKSKPISAQKLSKDLMKKPLPPPSINQTPSPEVVLTIESSETQPTTTQRSGSSAIPVIVAPAPPPLPPMVRQASAPPPLPPMVRQAPAPPPLPPMVRQAPAPPPLPPMVRQAPAPPPLPPMVRQAPTPPPLPPMVRQAPPAPLSPPAAIKETQLVPSDLIQIYRCPQCTAPLPAETIENLKNGHLDICSSCKTHLTGESTSLLPKKQSATELLQDDLIKVESLNIPPEKSTEVPIQISDKEIDDIITALEASAPPSKPTIQKEPSSSTSSAFEDVIKSLETKIKSQQVPPDQPLQASKPIQAVQPVQPAQNPPIVEYKCPFCNNLLAPQKIANLEKGINVLCPNCLKSIGSEQFSKK